MHRDSVFGLIHLVAALLRAFPHVPGRWRLVGLLLPWLRRNGRLFGRRLVQLRRYGLRFECNLLDWLGQYVFLTGCYEPSIERAMRAYVAPGDSVLDNGANAGYFSVLLAHLVGPTGAVHALEPVSTLRDVIRRQCALNPALNIILHAWAASDLETTATIFVGPVGHAGLSSLRALPEASCEESIQCRPVDSMLDVLSPVAFNKLDVEGCETKALRGMRGLLERDRPIILLEATDRFLRALGDTLGDLTTWLKAFDYRLYRVDGSLPECLLPLTSVGLPDQFDLLALPPDREQDVVAAAC